MKSKCLEMLHSLVSDPDHQAVAHHGPSPDMVPPSKLDTIQSVCPVACQTHHSKSRDNTVSTPTPCVVGQSGLAGSDESSDANAMRQPCTTLCIQNVPFDYTETEFVEELCWIVGPHAFDFVHLSPGRKGMITRGFGFVNFVDERTARWCFNVLSGHVWRRHQDAEVKQAIVTMA